MIDEARQHTNEPALDARFQKRRVQYLRLHQLRRRLVEESRSDSGRREQRKATMGLSIVQPQPCIRRVTGDLLREQVLRASKVPLGLLQVLLVPSASHPSSEPTSAIISVDRDGLIEIVDGTIELVLVQVCEASIDECLDRLGEELDGLIEIVDGTIEPVQLHERNASVHEHVRHRRIQRDGLRKVVDGVLELVLQQVRDASIVEGRLVRGLKCDGSIQVADGLRELVILDKRDTAIVEGFNLRGIERDGLRKVAYGLLEVVLLEERVAAIEERQRALGIELDLLIMVLNGLREQVRVHQRIVTMTERVVMRIKHDGFRVQDHGARVMGARVVSGICVQQVAR